MLYECDEMEGANSSPLSGTDRYSIPRMGLGITEGGSEGEPDGRGYVRQRDCGATFLVRVEHGGSADKHAHLMTDFGRV